MKGIAAMQTAGIDLSIIIVSWNVSAFLADCLQSLLRPTPLTLEIIVVDNASKDDSVAMVRERFPGVVLIANSENVGFAAGNNQGIAVARGRFVFFLNPDTVVVDSALETLVDVLNRDSDVGMVGPQITFPDGTVQRDCARSQYSLTTALFCTGLRFHQLPVVGSWFGQRLMFPYDFTKRQDVSAVTGAAVMVRKEVLDRIGGFDDCFLFCGEDIDLCRRTWQAGWKLRYVPEATIIHFSGQSSKQAQVRNLVNSALSVQHYFYRNAGALHALAFRAIVVGIHVPVDLTVGALKALRNPQARANFKIRWNAAKGLWRWKAL